MRRGIRIGRAPRLMVLWATLGAAGSFTWADVWTNAAGHAIEAQAGAFDGQTVLLQRPNGAQVRLPAFSLAAPEQQRLRRLFNLPDIPPALLAPYRQAEEQIRRAQAMLARAIISPAEYRARRQTVVRVFLAGCAKQSYAGDAEPVQQLVARLEAQ